MKLPEDKAERTKVLGLMGIGVAATIYVIARYGVLPIYKSKQMNTKRIVEITEILKKADLEVKLISQVRADNEKAIREIKKSSDNHLLHPTLGDNYLIPATKVIDEITDKANQKIGIPMVAGGGQIPGPSLPQPNDLKTYGMNISLDCGLAAAVKLLDAVRDVNPYIVVSRFSMMAQPNSPELHKVDFMMSWPAWTDPKMRARTDALFAAMNKPQGDGK